MSGTRSFWRLASYRVGIVFVIGLTSASVQAEKEFVQGKAEVSFRWPESYKEIAEANRIPAAEIEDLANQLRPPYEEKLRVGEIPLRRVGTRADRHRGCHGFWRWAGIHWQDRDSERPRGGAYPMGPSLPWDDRLTCRWKSSTWMGTG